MPAPALIWFADDWGRHPSSSQHLAQQLLLRRRIHWINTIGTRKPRINVETFKRGIEKLRQWSQPKSLSQLPENLSVSNPRMWPWFSHSWDRWLNRRLLVRHLKQVVAKHNDQPIVVTTLPLTADLVGRVGAKRWVYYCVDDFTVWPGLDGRAMRTMEERLVKKVDRIIVVSETLRERIRSLGRDSELLTHGVDLEFWSNGEPCSVRSRVPVSLDTRLLTEHGSTVMLFWGVIDRRMDTGIVRKLVEANLGQVTLVGPHNDPDSDLLGISKLNFMPAQPLEALPALARQASVLIMPYADLPVTRAIQPLKLKEYLATGLPCVATDLPANREWADCLDLANTPESFVAAVAKRMEVGIAQSQRIARRRLEQESWSEKARQFERMIDE